MSKSSTTLTAGTVLAERYELTAEIGRGGFGMVYRARQLNIDRDVAVKVLPPQFMTIPDVVERFRREARLASRLHHPNTITIHDYGKHDNFLFIVMEYLAGEDLADILKREHRLPAMRIMHIARQVLKSLAEAHEIGIVHRDLKPENIFLSVVGDEADFVKVLDFGIAKLAMPAHASAGDDQRQRQLTVSGSTVGTPAYMSPEQAAGEDVDGQSDLYALGVIMYELACGRPPFVHKNPVKAMRAHLFEPVPAFKDSSLHGTLLERIIHKALCKEKEDRFRSANEFLAALNGDINDEPPTLELDANQLDESLRDDDPGLDKADTIPFATLSNTVREATRPGFSRSPERTVSTPSPAGSKMEEEPPPGFISKKSSSTSSIITVLEPGPEPSEEVFLLTKPKTPMEAEPAQTRQVSEQVASPQMASEDWSWGGRESSSTDDDELDFPGAPRSLKIAVVLVVGTLVAMGTYLLLAGHLS